MHLHQFLVALAEIAGGFSKFTHIHHGGERWRRRRFKIVLGSRHWEAVTAEISGTGLRTGV